MEHKLFLGGGEQYLPFARSRIKALRASGMQYAQQQYELPDGSVKIRIQGNQDYITLSGGINYETLSGAIKAGDLIDLPIPAGSPAGTKPKKTLRNFRPTVQTWQYPLKSDPTKSPDAYNDEPRLGVEAHADIGVTGSQYTDLCASMYSGEMARVAQIALGVTPKGGKAQQIHYDYRWAKCHGVFFFTATHGTGDAAFDYAQPWLIEISKDNGVLAMPLPLLKGTGFGEAQNSKLNTSHQFAEQYCITNYHGLPSGVAFPTGDKLTKAITDKKVLQLLSVAGMSAVFSKTMFSSALGWSFTPGDATSKRAQNTCYTLVGGVYTAFRYQLAFTLDAKKLTGSATLTEVDNGILRGTNSTFNRFSFYEPNTGAFVLTPMSPWPGSPPSTEDIAAPVFACWSPALNDFDVVRHCSTIWDLTRYERYSAPYCDTTGQWTPWQYGYKTIHSGWGIPNDPTSAGPAYWQGAVGTIYGAGAPLACTTYEVRTGSGIGTQATFLSSTTHPSDPAIHNVLRTETGTVSYERWQPVTHTWPTTYASMRVPVGSGKPFPSGVIRYANWSFQGYGSSTRHEEDVTTQPATGLWPGGVRDGYVFQEMPKTGSQIDTVSSFDPLDAGMLDPSGSAPKYYAATDVDWVLDTGYYYPIWSVTEYDATGTTGPLGSCTRIGTKSLSAPVGGSVSHAALTAAAAAFQSTTDAAPGGYPSSSVSTTAVTDNEVKLHIMSAFSGDTAYSWVLADAAARNAEQPKWVNPSGYKFIVRESAFGDSQYVQSDYFTGVSDPLNLLVTGSLISSESPSAKDFSFIGYTTYDFDPTL